MKTVKKKYPLFDQPSEHLIAFGIVTDDPDYRVCWLLNQWGGFGLTRVDDIHAFPVNTPNPQAYSCFYNGEADPFKSMRLIANKSTEGIWLTHFKQVDFLLLMDRRTTASAMIISLKKQVSETIPQIRGLFEIPVSSLAGPF